MDYGDISLLRQGVGECLLEDVASPEFLDAYCGKLSSSHFLVVYHTGKTFSIFNHMSLY